MKKGKSSEEMYNTLNSFIWHCVHAYHKHLEEQYINNLSMDQLLSLSHPIDRESFLHLLHKIKIIADKEEKEIAKNKISKL